MAQIIGAPTATDLWTIVVISLTVVMLAAGILVQIGYFFDGSFSLDCLPGLIAIKVHDQAG